MFSLTSKQSSKVSTHQHVLRSRQPWFRFTHISRTFFSVTHSGALSDNGRWESSNLGGIVSSRRHLLDIMVDALLLC